jgi:exodeoxyribonuclease III
MKLVSWNVNGVRAVAKKGFDKIVSDLDADIIGLQETKAQDDQVVEAASFDEYELNTNSAVKKGYSGTAVYSRKKPLNVIKGIGIEEHDQEGRVVTCEFEDFFFVTVYVPNSKHGLARIDYRQTWDKDFFDFCKKLEESKPVVICGDLNVAHRDIDLKNPKPNYDKNPGFTQREIDGLDRFMDNGFVDTFRHFNPEEVKYSWWSYRAGARDRNVGWRIDYFLVSESIIDKVEEAFILNDVFGSDHCPVGIRLKGLK